MDGKGEYEKNLDAKVKNDKKAQAKEQLKIIKQFDTLAEQFQKSATTFQGDGPDVKKETAGMIKRKDKKKKEKTLAAKLRLKAKKNK